MEHTKYTKISTIRKFPAIRYVDAAARARAGYVLYRALVTHLFIKIRMFNESNTEMYSLGLEALVE